MYSLFLSFFNEIKNFDTILCKKSMIYMELGPSMIVGLAFSIIGFILYFIRTNKPNVSRGVT